MIKNKWIKAGATGLLSLSVLAACGGEDEPAAVEEEPVEEEVAEEPAVEEEVANEVDFGNIAEEDLQTTYLDPLGWDAAEFDTYLTEEFDMNLTDFGDFAELESTVGPVEEIDASAIE